ncbi:tRNA wybutosine-synthesizing protein 4 [Cryptotermes secundus]|uniref:tRNA wybutosine-synthesizing protein 4 n=1 Tax=Cryptotermes secundus TaxID=105785 RepID=A0A2J7R4C4_9NEOP|nr:tRNA wybutosine-synthesizing protein 4 isoform X2 [Cryptotermes secundus]PNF35678.1 tRNA wybutosine-synthesizing protein 4 [Cryptotermes secundus]
MKKSKAQVQGTNDFNTISKCSMVKCGYFRDDYVSYFVTRCSRRTPLIHLGYYMRVLTVDYALRSFLDSVLGQPAQIISCGAGFDTSFFRLATSGSVHPEIYFYEVDFTEVVDRKAECILDSKPLLDCIGSFEMNQNGVRGLVGSQYHLIASDLQALDKLEANLIQAGLMFSLPTLLLSECSICYMDEASSSLLIQWAASKFEDATFVTYEQIYPDDGFGIVMQKHFESMNSPLLSLAQFPDLESQEHRYVSRGWSSCGVWTAFEMFQQIASPEERWKIINLEPFDELEEWHLEGCHFGLMVASKGSLTGWFLKFVDVLPPVDKCIKKPSIQWELAEPSSGKNVSRFAQKTVKFQEKDGFNILVVGGFGPSAKSLHGRRHEVLSINDRDQHTDVSVTGGRTLRVEDVALESAVNLDMLHHTCTCLSLRGPDDTARVMVYGGRYSPCSPVNVWPRIFSVLAHDVGTRMTVADRHIAVTERQNVPVSRWRHSAVCLKSSTPSAVQDYVVVFGGRTPDFKVLGDVVVWTVQASDMTVSCKEVLNQKDWPRARFSHSASVWRKQTMVVSGGLGQDVLPLRDIWCFSLEGEMWSELRVDGMLPRYSHTSAVCGDKMILIGGVNTLPGSQPGVCVVDLNTASCTEYALPVQNPACPIMLHNHTSELTDNETAVLVVGGGGNCFSFGTVFNSRMIRIDLQQFK